MVTCILSTHPLLRTCFHITYSFAEFTVLSESTCTYKVLPSCFVVNQSFHDVYKYVASHARPHPGFSTLHGLLACNVEKAGCGLACEATNMHSTSEP